MPPRVSTLRSLMRARCCPPSSCRPACVLFYVELADLGISCSNTPARFPCPEGSVPALQRCPLCPQFSSGLPLSHSPSSPSATFLCWDRRAGVHDAISETRGPSKPARPTRRPRACVSAPGAWLLPWENPWESVSLCPGAGPGPS